MVIKKIAKVVFFPITYPIDRYKKHQQKKFDEIPKVAFEVDTDYPEAYVDYFETDGHEVDITRRGLIVWDKRLNRNQIENIKSKMAKKLSETV